jgi:lysozyme
MVMAKCMATKFMATMATNSTAEYIIKRFEGLRLQPYYCPAGLPTIGWGHVIKIPEQQQMLETITKEQADQLLEQDMTQAKSALYRHCRIPLSYSQEGALISFIFNCGAAAFQASTLRQKLLRGEYLLAADEFPKWVHARGIRLKGLVRRRLLEREVFLQGIS